MQEIQVTVADEESVWLVEPSVPSRFRFVWAESEQESVVAGFAVLQRQWEDLPGQLPVYRIEPL